MPSTMSGVLSRHARSTMADTPVPTRAAWSSNPATSRSSKDSATAAPASNDE